MKRIHLFEIEDFSWFPNWIRIRLTRLINVMHKLFKTDEKLTRIIRPLLEKADINQIIDLCSGSGGPMVQVLENLRKETQFKNLKLVLTDLYPNLEMAKRYKNSTTIEYHTKPVDATKILSELKGLKTMVCSFHHMKPELAKEILKSAKENKETICIYEISDNSFPIILNVFTFCFNFINCFFITPFVKPLSWQQFIFTYLIPILPLGFAWDGAVSNARTYTLKDLDILLEGLHSKEYRWEKGKINGVLKSMYLIGQPV